MTQTHIVVKPEAAEQYRLAMLAKTVVTAQSGGRRVLGTVVDVVDLDEHNLARVEVSLLDARWPLARS